MNVSSGSGNLPPLPPPPPSTTAAPGQGEQPQYVVQAQYADCHCCWGLLMPALLYFLIGTPGMVMNGYVIYVTIRSK